jgi:hypothetical protein
MSGIADNAKITPAQSTTGTHVRSRRDLGAGEEDIEVR